jgi:hypothetical protein
VDMDLRSSNFSSLDVVNRSHTMAKSAFCMIEAGGKQMICQHSAKIQKQE